MPPAIGERFSLGWSHYVALLTIGNPEERGFYEIETVANGWSVRELERQIAASLYERLALSRDKSEVRRLSSEGQVVEKASDLVKNPLVLEFPRLRGKAGLLRERSGGGHYRPARTFPLGAGQRLPVRGSAKAFHL